MKNEQDQDVAGLGAKHKTQILIIFRSN